MSRSSIEGRLDAIEQRLGQFQQSDHVIVRGLDRQIKEIRLEFARSDERLDQLEDKLDQLLRQLEPGVTPRSE